MSLASFLGNFFYFCTDDHSDTRLNSKSPYPSPFTIAYREQLSRMEITLSPRKLLWMFTPWFKRLVQRKRHQLFKQLRPFIIGNIGVVRHGPRTIVRSAVEKFSRELLTKESALIPQDPSLFRQHKLNPEYVTKLQAEHDAILGPDPYLAAEEIREAPHILDSLQYTLGVIKESLRMNPATITIREGQPLFTFKIKGDDDPWPTDGFDLFDSSITIHHDPANFADPLKFIPERFSVSEGDRLHPAKDMWRGF